MSYRLSNARARVPMPAWRRSIRWPPRSGLSSRRPGAAGSAWRFGLPPESGPGQFDA